MQTMTATDAKNNFGGLMLAIESGPVSITRNGRPVATLSAVLANKAAVPCKSGSPASHVDVNKLLRLYADGMVSRYDVQDETRLTFDEILEKAALAGLVIPIVRTFERYNDNQKSLYDEIFRATV